MSALDAPTLACLSDTSALRMARETAERMISEGRRRDAIYRLREIGLLDDNFDATPAGLDLLATVTR